MKRGRSMRPAVALLVGTLACLLVSTTSYALYRTSMGPEQCCKSHCPHSRGSGDAERCCRSNLQLFPAVVSKNAVAHASTPMHVVVTALPLAPATLLVVGHRSFNLEERIPSLQSLVAQRTSLVR